MIASERNDARCPSPWVDRAFYFALLVAPSLLMIRALVAGAIPHFMDPVMYFFPLRVHAARILAAGEWPLWNRCLMGGMPLLENPQAAVVYPLNWPSLLWPGGFWFTFPQLFQLGLYGALTAWALRRLGVGRRVAFWAGALALAGSYGWSRLQFGNYLNVIAWWPLWIGALHAPIHKAERGMRNADLFFGTVAVAMPLLGGAHQPASYGLFALGVFAVVLALPDRVHRRRRLLFLAFTYGFGILIAAPGWLPQISFLRETARAEGVDPNQVLGGAVASFRQLFDSLSGGLSLRLEHPPGGWADAEGQAAIGVVALLLALIPARGGARRRAWLALWIAALVTIALASRPVVALLFKITPLAGLFHDPRRWLGVTQWLLLLAAALGIERLLHSLRAHAGARMKVAAALLVLVVLVQAFLTWRDTDLATISQRHLVRSAQLSSKPPDKPGASIIEFKPFPLIANAELQPGQRFLSIDAQRSSSYNFRRSDLTDWSLPNRGMLWGYEDLGGYEPAQSRRWREFTPTLQDTAWRRLWPRHFSLASAPWRTRPLDEGNVVAAIMPRWGLPLYLQPREGRLWQTGPPELAAESLSLQALLSNGEDAEINVSQSSGPPFVRFSAPERIGFQHDQTIRPTSSTVYRFEPRGKRVFWSAHAEVSPISTPASQTVWGFTIPVSKDPFAEIHEIFFWNERLAGLWEPVAVREIATLMRYRGMPSRYVWPAGAGRVLGESIRHNRLDLDCEVGPLGGSLVIHDATWPGWQATIEDGTPIPIDPDGPWRRVELPAGRHTLTMTYRPVWLPPALSLSVVGLLGGMLVAVVARRRGRRGALARTKSIDNDDDNDYDYDGGGSGHRCRGDAEQDRRP